MPTPKPRTRQPVTLRLSRRAFLKAAGLGAAGALGACAPRPGLTALESAGTVQLVYQDWRTDWFPPLAQQMLEQFHAQHPNIRVFYTPDPDNIEETMLADLEAGTAPDVLQGCCDFFPIWAQLGYLLDLRPYAQAELDAATIAEWDPAQYRALFTREGLQFGLPKYHGALVLFYNKDLFDEVGQAYPDAGWTHDDYRQAMLKLTLDRDGDRRLDQWGSMLDIAWERLQVHVNAWGGHFVDPDDPTRSRMASPETLAALEWIRSRIWTDRCMASFLNVQNMETRRAFTERKVAMVEDGSWALRDILTQAGFRIGVAPLPSGPVRRTTLATTDGFGIYAGTRHPEAAWELLRFLSGPEYGRAMAQAHFLQPARASLVGDWITFIRSEFPSQTREMDLAVFAEGHLQGYSVTAEIFANMADARRLCRSAWEQIFTLGRAPTELMVEISRQIEAAQPAAG